LPDLRVSRPQVDLAEAVTGAPLTRAVLVSNVGLTPSPATRVDFQLVAGGAVRLTGSAPVPAIAPGATATVAIDLGVQGAPADAVLQVVANPTADFAEGELDQNVVAIAFRIRDLADLVVTPADIALVPNPPVLHEANRVTVRVTNAGEAMAHNVLVQLFEGDPGAGGTLIDQIVLNAVAAGTPRTFTATYVPRTTAPTRLYARVDPAGTIRERDETNNTAWIPVQPENPAELYVDLRPNAGVLWPGPAGAPFPQGEQVLVRCSIGGVVKRFTNLFPYTNLWPFGGVPIVVFDGTPGSLGVEIARNVIQPYIYCNDFSCQGVNSPTIDVALPRNAAPGVHRISVLVDPDHQVPDRDRSNDVATVDVTISNPGLPEMFVESMGADRYSVAKTRPSTIHASVMNSGVADAVAVPYTITFPTRVVQGTIPYLGPGDH
jgi:hypothetical protein